MADRTPKRPPAQSAALDAARDCRRSVGRRSRRSWRLIAAGASSSRHTKTSTKQASASAEAGKLCLLRYGNRRRCAYAASHRGARRHPALPADRLSGTFGTDKTDRFGCTNASKTKRLPIQG